MITKKAQIFFCKASLSCFATGGTYSPIEDSPWKKRRVVKEEDFTLEDTYWSIKYSLYSTGETVIYYKNKPYWIMQYGGFYLEEALPCLKDSLTKAYTDLLFNGGRGPRSRVYGRYLYANLSEGNFERFSGREDVFAFVTGDNSELIGYHTYQGWLL